MNQFDGANVARAGQANVQEQQKTKKCKWSNCKKHVKDLNPDYKQGNVERQGDKVRDNLIKEEKEPWKGGGHGETNIRLMYLDQRNDGVITIKADSHDYRLQAHHIIPVEQIASTGTLKDNAALAGWDINGLSNGMLLPRDEADVALHLLQQHNGSHPGGYTKPISDYLESLEKSYKDACQDMEDVSVQLMLASELEQLSDHIRGQIIAIRQHAHGADYLGVHSDSLSVYTQAVQTWHDRRARYIDQQRQQIKTHTKNEGTT